MVDRENRKVLVFTAPSRTKQSFKDECDLNIILKKFKKVCDEEYLNRFNGYVSGQFGDFSGVVDYRTALDQVNQAKGLFGALPAKVRSRFGNDPSQFLDFVQDPKNADEMVSLGLIDKKPTVVPAAGVPNPVPAPGK